jgi:hypothetical protein
MASGRWRAASIGSTQADNPLASNAGPFNPFISGDGKTKGMACAVDPVSGAYNASYCMSNDDGVSIQLSNFSDFQRFSVSMAVPPIRIQMPT